PCLYPGRLARPILEDDGRRGNADGRGPGRLLPGVGFARMRALLAVAPARSGGDLGKSAALAAAQGGRMHYRGTVNAPVAAAVLPWLLVLALLGAIGLAMLDPGKAVELLGDGRYTLVDGDALPPPPEPRPTVAAAAAGRVAVPAAPGPAPTRGGATAVQARPVAGREAAAAAPRQVQGSGLPRGEAGLAALLRAGVPGRGSPAEFDNGRNRHAVSTGRVPS